MTLMFLNIHIFYYQWIVVVAMELIDIKYAFVKFSIIHGVVYVWVCSIK